MPGLVYSGQLEAEQARQERFAEQYFSYYVTNNYEEMYKMIDCEESDFINLDNFIIKCEGEMVYGSITGYEISKPVKQGKM